MLNESFINKLKLLPDAVKQFGTLISIIILVILSFAVLNNIFSDGDELVAKMKAEEERIVNERKLNKLLIQKKTTGV